MSKSRSSAVHGTKTGSRRLRLESLEPRYVLAANVVISELLASNQGGLSDGDGDSPDWIELFNADSADVDLGGYFLTDDRAELAKWAFPAGTIVAPGSTLLVFASDKGDSGPAGELHTDFKLSSGGEYLGLVEPNGRTVVHEYAPAFPPQESNISYGLSMTTSEFTLVDESSTMRYVVPTNAANDSTWREATFDDAGWSVGTAGIGYENSPGGSNDYTTLIDTTVATNTRTAYTRFTFSLADAEAVKSLTLQMMYDDGFVAYLNGERIAADNEPASLAWNSAANGSRGDGTVLDAFVEYDVSSHANALQTGENVLAVHALNNSSSSDMLMIARLIGASAELVQPQVAGYFTDATPGAPNSETFLGIVADTKFDIDRGFYDEPFSLKITTETLGAIIVYTTDGSAPTVNANQNVTNGSLYTGPLQISGTTNVRAAAFKSGYAPTNVDTQTYIFTSDVIQQTRQSALASGLPTSWGSRSADYGLDPDVIGPNDRFGGVYVDLIEDSLTAIPTISLTLDNEDFFGSSGIYSNQTNQGVAWERPTSAELIFPNGEEGFQIDSGLRVHGGASRNLSKKNALRLLFKSEYGDTKLRYPLFGEDGVDRFDTIVLRPHFNDGWGWGGAEDDPLFIRDQWFRDTQAAMGHASSRGNLAHLYINGLYWGLYNPSERPDDSFAAEHFGGDKLEYDVVNHDGLHKGEISAYNQMLSFATTLAGGASATAKNQAYQQLQGRLPDGSVDPNGEVYLDVVNYIDYMILNHYGGNNDWPNRNWFANRRRGAESEGFRFFAWDSEISLALSSRTSLTENNLSQTTGAATAYGRLSRYEEFRLAFADRIHKHLFNGGALYVDSANATYDPQNRQSNIPASRFADLSDTVYDAMVAESARWGDQHVSTPRTRNIDWQNELNYMLGTYFRDRHGIVMNQWRDAGLYPETHAPEFFVNQSRQHGGTFEPGSTIVIANPNRSRGTTYFTTDGSDPRLTGGAVNTESAQVFANNITLLAQTKIKTRVLYNGEWSALTEATFNIPENADFNADGIVDAADFTIWRDNLGNEGVAGQPGDANYDGVVDTADHEAWISQFGTSPAPAALATEANATNSGSKVARVTRTPRAAPPAIQVNAIDEAIVRWKAPQVSKSWWHEKSDDTDDDEQKFDRISDIWSLM